MRFLQLAFGLLVALSPSSSATALTYKLSPNEKACFYTYVDNQPAKVAFYFAVCDKLFNDPSARVQFIDAFELRSRAQCPQAPANVSNSQVQSGGSFDVDYSVVGPNDKIILDGAKERQADYVFTANIVGEYRFCFNNEMSTFAEKLVDFEIAVENESRASLPQKQGTTPEQTSALEDTIFKLSGQISTINRMQKYFRTRENRNFSTVASTEKRILNFSLIEVGMMVGMAGLQVFIVRFFFQGARKGYV